MISQSPWNGGDEDVAVALAADLLSRGAEPTDLTDALARAMHRLGQRFHRLEAFVPDLLVAADAFEAAMRVVEPALKRTPRDAKGVVVLGVVEGDIHTLGMAREGDARRRVELGEEIARPLPHELDSGSIRGKRRAVGRRQRFHSGPYALKALEHRGISRWCRLRSRA